MELTVGDNFLEVVQFRRRDVDNVVGFVVVLHIPKVEGDVIRTDEVLAVSTLRHRVDVELVPVHVCVLQFGPVLALPLLLVLREHDLVALPEVFLRRQRLVLLGVAVRLRSVVPVVALAHPHLEQFDHFVVRRQQLRLRAPVAPVEPLDGRQSLRDLNGLLEVEFGLEGLELGRVGQLRELTAAVFIVALLGKGEDYDSAAVVADAQVGAFLVKGKRAYVLLGRNALELDVAQALDQVEGLAGVGVGKA